MTSISKNFYINKLDDIVNAINTIIHTIEQLRWNQLMLRIIHNNSMELPRSNDKDPKFKVSGHVRISKFKNIFAKGYTPSWSEEVFVIKKVKNTVPWTCY